jgi:hypothetical protein
MRGGAVVGWQRRGRPPDGASCSRRAGLQQCKSFVEMCIVSCLSTSPACVCGRVAATWDCPRCRLPCRSDSPAPAENPHADGDAASGAHPRFRPPLRHDPHVTSPAPTTTGCREDRCPVVNKLPLHSCAAAKMSPHIRIGPEPVLADHAPSPPAAGSHSPAREVSAPYCGTEFRAREKNRAPQIFLTDCDFPHSFWKEIKIVGAVPRNFKPLCLHS